MSEKLIRAGYFQFDVSHNKQLNYEASQQALAKADCSLAVLPELCTCGYLFSSRSALLGAAEPVPEGESTRFFSELSRRHACTVVFGTAERDGELLYNTAVIVSRGKYIGKYRKRHLSDFEKNFFRCGTQNAVFDAGGLKIGVQICFDLWFPEISREQILQGADILCVPAAFGAENTHTISQVRAMENLTPLILCNRTGTERNETMDAYFCGKSSIIDASGARLGADKPDEMHSFCREILCGSAKGNLICRDFLPEIARHHSGNAK